MSDADRVLTHSGKQDAIKLAYKLKGRNERIDLVCVSSAMRTRQTLDVLMEISGDCILSTEVVAALYQASERTALQVIGDLGSPAQSVMLVGHNPSMTQLSNLLAADLRLDHLPTCGLVVIDFDVKQWQDVGAGSGRVSWFDFPKNDYSIL